MIEKTFEKWCEENHKQEFLKRWSKKNNVLPSEVSFSSNFNYYFDCLNYPSEHKTRAIPLNKIVRGDKCKCKECNSFGQWCINNNRKDLLHMWDKEKNGKTAFEVSQSTDKPCYFKVCNEHDSQTFTLSNIKKNKNPKCSICNSFGTYFENKYSKDLLDQLWDSEKNEKTPYEYDYASGKTVYINCINGEHESHDIKISHIGIRGQIGCPFCDGHRVHKSRSVGIIYPESLELWSEKNEKSPYEYTSKSNYYVWWKCPNNKHEDFKRKINNSVNSGFRCPNCVGERTQSFLQEKISSYLTELGFSTLHEHGCTFISKNPKTNALMPIDNEIVINGSHLFIEVQGIQHYEITKYTQMTATRKGTTVEEELKEQQWRDEYKRKDILSHGYYYLAIPYWTEKDESYKKLIDDKIKEIKNI